MTDGKTGENTATPTAKRRAVREKDGPIQLFDARLVNKPVMAKTLRVSQRKITQLINDPAGGMPHIRIGLRYLFDPEAVLAWFKSRETQFNLPRSRKQR